MSRLDLSSLHRYGPAAGVAALGLAGLLALQVGLQLNSLQAARRDLAAQEAALKDLGGRPGPGNGVAVVAPAGRHAIEASTLLRRQATASGLAVTGLAVGDIRPAGSGRRTVQLRLKASGRALAVDALARWMQRHGGAVRLDRLDMTTLPDGDGIAQVEADVTVLAALPESGR